MKKTRAYQAATLDALTALGTQIGAARRELGWTAADLAERLGTTRALVSRIESGLPGTSVGIVFEAAVICGVPLFGADSERDLAGAASVEKARLALLPERVRPKVMEIDDDF